MIYIVTGAGGSGKSEFAEKLAVSLAERETECHKIYAATMINDGWEAGQRIKRHKKLRDGKGFVTLETPFGLHDFGKPMCPLQEHCGGEKTAGMVILLECMSNLLANLMFEKQMSGEAAYLEIQRQIREVQCRHLVIVTNEIFSDGAVYEGEMQEYQQALGRINQWMMQQADAVCEVVYSIPFFLKGEAGCLY